MAVQIKGYIYPHSNLAAAIILSAEKENDQAFFKTEWYELLKDMLELDVLIQNEKNKDVKIIF